MVCPLCLFVGCKFGGNLFSPIIFDAVFGGMHRRFVKCLYEELLSEVMHTIHLEGQNLYTVD